MRKRIAKLGLFWLTPAALAPLFVAGCGAAESSPGGTAGAGTAGTANSSGATSGGSTSGGSTSGGSTSGGSNAGGSSSGGSNAGSGNAGNAGNAGTSTTGVVCGSMTCGAKQYCRAACCGTPGCIPGGPTCADLPDGCHGVASCQCICDGTALFCTEGAPQVQCGCA